MKYVTISVPERVKKMLEKGKGDRDWGEYLMHLYKELERLKRERSFERLASTLNEEEIEEIRRSSLEFRRGFRLE
jgi:predicted CopG family antitoxin